MGYEDRIDAGKLIERNARFTYTWKQLAERRLKIGISKKPLSAKLN
jgi:hypothetical protein